MVNIALYTEIGRNEDWVKYRLEQNCSSLILTVPVSFTPQSPISRVLLEETLLTPIFFDDGTDCHGLISTNESLPVWLILGRMGLLDNYNSQVGEEVWKLLLARRSAHQAIEELYDRSMRGLGVDEVSLKSGNSMWTIPSLEQPNIVFPRSETMDKLYGSV